MTILFSAFILGFSLVTFRSILNCEHYNLETSGFGIQGYQLQNDTFFEDIFPCDRPECKVITMRDLLI